MPKTVTARFESEEEAERALAAVAVEVPLRDSAVFSGDMAGRLMLDSLHLTPEERSACEQQLSKGGFLLVAQVATESRGETVLRLLDDMHRVPEPEAAAPWQAPVSPAPASAPVEHRFEDPAAPQAPAPDQPPAEARTTEEAPVPIVEEELRIGTREVVRGRSRVHTYVAEVPVREEVELLEEETQVERRPVNRRLSDEEVAAGGLLQERVIEIAEMREEAVVTKEAFVREELVVRKNVHRRVEQINEVVRRTQVETERVEPEPAYASGSTGDAAT
jgi:stress response protein YsnF